MTTGIPPGHAAPKGGQASLTLSNCNGELCHASDTGWTLTKTGPNGALTGQGPNGITWTATATKGETSDNVFTAFGVLTITNTGSAPATIGNIVINLQKPRTGPNTGACRNIPWVSAAANVADATSGDAATQANVVANGSQEHAACNAAQGPQPGGNYTVSGAKGTFKRTAGSGALSFTDANDNTLWAITPEQTIAVGASVTLRYTATFDIAALGLAVGSSVRTEAIVTFGNAGDRGGSGASAANIDIDGDGLIYPDEANVRSVPCRVTRTIPPVVNANAQVTLTDGLADVTTSGTGISFDNFATTVGGGNGVQDLTTSGSFSVSVDEYCAAPGAGAVTNTAYLDGADLNVIVLGPQIGVDPSTLQPLYAEYSFTCVAGVELEASHSVQASCDTVVPPTLTFTDGDYCTYTQGKYNDNANNPVANYLSANFGSLTFPAPGAAGLLRIGIEDGGGPRHDAEWTVAATFRTWVGGGGPSGALTADTSNASSTSGGTLAKQVGTLAVNIAQSGVMPGDPVGLGTLKLCNLAEGSTIGGWTLTAAQAAALNGRSFAQILADANGTLGGDGLPSYVGSAGDLNQLVSRLNSDTFDDCKVGSLATLHVCRP